MRKIKHWAGYGTVQAERVKDPSCKLHIRVVGNHECGLSTWADTAYGWLVHRFDKSAPQYFNFQTMFVDVREGFTETPNTYGNYTETCDFLFTY